jgi:Mitochondrial ribosomal protein L37
LGYLKSKPVVLAMEDDDYPEWLWKLLDPETGTLSRAELSDADVAGMRQPSTLKKKNGIKTDLLIPIQHS